MLLETPTSIPRALGAVVALLLTLGLTTFAVGAQDDVTELEELKEEREAIQAELADQAVKVDAATADFDTLVEALDDVNALVDLQEARLADATQRVNSAETQASQAQGRQDAIEAELAVLRGEVRDLALASFTGESSLTGGDATAVLLSNDPSVAARRRSLIELQAGSLNDSVDRMRALGAEAEVLRIQRDEALATAQASRDEAEARQTELDAARAAQADLVGRAELRLEARLAEASVIEERDAAAAAEITRQEEAIASRIRQEAARQAAIEAAEAREQLPQVTAPSDITTVNGIQVHVSIAGRVGDLLAAATADGIALSGWGYRDSLRQIELRQAHCGTTEYDIWEKPAFACSPPTARPGQSLHERGLAIDFTYNGGSMTSQSNPGFQWLASNAHRWGFVNLPSEPWHWSTTGE